MRSDEMKLAFISKTINDYRKLAQREILADPEFRGFANYVALLKDDKMQQRLPLVVQ
jgi:hypothetical protein